MNKEVWYAHYDYSYKGTRCNKNIEPTNVKKSNCYRRYYSKADAEKVYRDSLRNHVSAIMSSMSDFTNKTMDARLRKYGLAREADLLQHIQNLVDKSRQDL